jgi:hypothetical protein
MWCPSRGAPMSDNLRNAGPAGQPRATAPSSGPLSPPRSLSGRSDEGPTSPMRRPAPWPAPGESRVHGPLSPDHMDEYVSRVFRPCDPGAEEPSGADEEEREFEEMLAAVRRKKPGHKKVPAPPPKPRRPRGRPGSDDKKIYAAIRRDHPGDGKAEFFAALEENKILKGLWAQKFRVVRRWWNKSGGHQAL